MRSCSWRPGWNTSPWQVRGIINSGQGICESCDHHADIRVVATQFRLGQAQWWAVNGRVVVPIWVVEFLRKHPERRRKPRDSSAVLPPSDSGHAQAAHNFP